MTTVSGATLHPVRVSARTTWLLVEVQLGQHIRWGECSDAGDPDQARAWLADLLGLILDRPVDRARSVLTAAVEHASLGPRTVAAALLAALEPHPLPATPVPLYANINRASLKRTPAGFAELASRAVGAGFSAVKLAPFDGLSGTGRAAAGLACAQAVRAAIGDAELMVDVHNLLDDDELDSVLPGFAELGLRWLEDAAPLERPERLRAIRDRSGIPLAGGETAARVQEFRVAVESGALDIVLPDVKHAGGPGQALALGRAARALGAAVSLHNPSGPVATSVSASVSAALGDALPLEYMFGEEPGRRSLVPGERIRNGYWEPPSGGEPLAPDMVRAGASR